MTILKSYNSSLTAWVYLIYMGVKKITSQQKISYYLTSLLIFLKVLALIKRPLKNLNKHNRKLKERLQNMKIRVNHI